MFGRMFDMCCSGPSPHGAGRSFFFVGGRQHCSGEVPMRCISFVRLHGSYDRNNRKGNSNSPPSRWPQDGRVVFLLTFASRYYRRGSRRSCM
ncbi:uncharacterized protein TEOVI_000525300 [Trypanosoma equiperdum]|uniref:Uncharacterized protein n=2 Tax=Trypanozoon TaxID=39700 RepID=Q38AP8_TRYB2|nr:hypothetical protein Tb10.6k15.3550 [Trypanosoma brucei brucei TREU927]EAN78122.1 hypothetical protein Tb10.6k15.3550 [Trypanosoma brucei brucei TREU927]SCU68798.1 hypothetical protein, conserved [Trypanosoma equiperdum]